MPANMVAESTVSISTWIPTSARFCWIRAARLARWLVQARGEGLPIVSRLGQQFLAPFRVVGALPCWPGVLRARQDAGVGHRTQGTGVLLAQQFLVQGLSMAWRRSALSTVSLLIISS